MPEAFRLSPQQQRLWPLLENPAAGAWGAHVLVELVGDLDPAALAAAFGGLAERHELLRTTFAPRPGQPGQPVQIVGPARHPRHPAHPGLGTSHPCLRTPGPPAPLARHDLTALSPAARELAVEELWRGALAAPFDLGSAPLLRAALVAAAPGRHLLLASLPALLADAAGLDNLVRELAGAYAEAQGGGGQAAAAGVYAEAQGGGGRAEPAGAGEAAGAGEQAGPAQYVDLAEWHHELLAGETSEAGREYWRRWLAAAPAAAAAGAVTEGWTSAVDGTPPTAAGHAPASLPIALPAAAVAATAALAAARGVAPEAVLLAAWQVLLWRLAGGAEVTVGVAFSGRRFAELEGALGLFAHDLPVSIPLDEALPFQAVVERLATICRDHRDWQEYWTGAQAGEAADAGQLLTFAFEALPPPPAVPAVPAMAAASAALPGRLAPASPAGGLRFAVLRREVRRRRCVLELSCTCSASALEAVLRYDAAAVPPAWAALLAERFATVLADAAADPERPLGAIELLGPAERAQLLAWNATRADYPEEKLLHRLVAAQRARTPDRAAVAWEGGAMSYAELGRRVERLAGRLRGAGVGPEARVGICMERSPEMMVALLAVLEAGGAWVPLEPAYPRERLAFILADAAPRVLLTGPGAPDLAGIAGAAALVAVGSVGDAGSLAPRGGRNGPRDDVRGAAAGAGAGDGAAALPGGAAAPAAGPDNLAYVIYTSGSTGWPKGVMVQHAAIANRVLWLQHRFPVGDGDCVLHKTPFSFDASIWEVFLPWLSGARLVLARPDGHRDAAWLAAAVERHQVTILQLVPSLATVFLEEPAAGRGRVLRRLFCGGEALGGALRDRCLAELGMAPVNTYGPTECAIDATFWECGPGERGPAVPIGRPIANDRVHLLDQRLRPVPPGVAGELCIAGTGVARGYLGRPDLTAARFIPDAFGGEPGGRLYRSGDLARQDASGVLSFLGRIDDQIKLRGLRIELGEIESRLLLHPAVREAAVAVAATRDQVDGEPGGGRLVACYVPRTVVGGTAPPAPPAPPAPSTPGSKDFTPGSKDPAPTPGSMDPAPPAPPAPFTPGSMDFTPGSKGPAPTPGSKDPAPFTPGSMDFTPVSKDAAGAAPSDAELRAWMAAALPEPMVPAVYVARPALPRLPSGKPDRQAIAELLPREAAGFTAPRTPLEELLAAQLADLLEVERLGVHDSLFELGWHSLLAIQLATRLQRLAGVRLPLHGLFENLTVAALAARVHAALRGPLAAEPPPLVAAAGGRGRPRALSFAQQRLWFLDRWQPGSAFYNISMALRFDGPLAVRVLARALSEIVRRHESLRSRFVELEERPVLLVEPAPAAVASALPLPVIDLGGLPAERRQDESRRLLAVAAARPFDLAAGRLLRALLLRLDGNGERHLGLLTLHHIVSDGWSTGIMTAELGALYAAFAAGRPSPLAELPVQYADFAEWQRGWLQGEALDAHLDYWRRQLAGAPRLLALRTDRPRPPVQSFRGATRGRTMAPATVAAVRRLARQEGVTLFMAMLAAGQVLLGWHSGEEDLVVGTDVAGRGQPEAERLIGFFINQLALRTRLDGDPSFRALLGRVREVTVGAYAHQELPFDKLVEALNPERSRGYAPIFQVKVNLIDLPPPALELPGLTLTPVAVPRETAQFDWILNLYAGGDAMVAAVEYATDLFEPATIDRMLGGFEALLDAAAARPEARLSELAAVLAAADQEQREAEAAEGRSARREMLQRARRKAPPAQVPALVQDGELVEGTAK